jgi:hypothetical protein
VEASVRFSKNLSALSLAWKPQFARSIGKCCVDATEMLDLRSLIPELDLAADWQHQFGNAQSGRLPLFGVQKCPIFTLFSAFLWSAVTRSEFCATPADPLFMRFSKVLWAWVGRDSNPQPTP